MSGDDYRPKSPDLNFFGTTDPPPQQQPQPPPPHLQLSSQSRQPHPHPQYQSPLRVNPPPPPQNWYQSPQDDPYNSHSRSFSYSAHAQSPTESGFYSYQPMSATSPSYTSPRFPPNQYQYQQNSAAQAQRQAYEGQELEPYFPPGVSPHTAAFQPPAYHSPTGYHTQLPGYVKSEDPDTLDIKPAVKAEEAAEDSKMPPRRAAAAAAATDNPTIEPSPVKTKFPTARIKRIMQADEEVGKVAQQTPIAVGKALELFMIQLVSKSAEVAREKSSKRVTPAMLKQVVENDDQWDFLREIVSKVDPDKEGASGKGKAKAESDSEEDSDQPKKKRGGRKKKTA